MKKQFLPLMLLASAICSCSESQPTATEPMITKTEIQVENGHFTPEIMHRLGKVGDPQRSPNYGKILYGVSYTSIEQNKGNRELFLMNADGTENVKLTSTAKSESNARWISDSQIIYMRGGKLYTATIEGSTLKNEKEVADAEGMEGFELSPAGDKIMFIKSIKSAEKPTDKYPDLDKSSGHT